MKRFDEAFLTRLESAVADAERTTSAEIVVSIARASGSYSDVDLLAGAVATLASLLFMVFSPIDFHAYVVPTSAVAMFVLAALMARRAPPIRRLLTSVARRHRHARHDALVEFHEAQVSATRERTGILFYYSHLERRLEIVPDHGIDGKVSHAEWNAIAHRFEATRVASGAPDALLQAIDAAGKVLAQHFKPGAENPDEIPNRPRMRI